MTVRYAPEARRQLQAISNYIREHNPAAATRIGRSIRKAGRLLGAFPQTGHEGTLPGTREIAVQGYPYILVYRVDREELPQVVIVGVYHGAQLRPGQSKP